MIRFLLWLTLISASLAVAEPAVSEQSQEPPINICKNQTYALCASAECFVYDNVAYCKCDIKFGDSISSSASYTALSGEEVNGCDINRQGRFNGYMLSTYSLPPEVRKGGSQAMYTCPGSANTQGGIEAPVAYAQADGAFCFTSTKGQRFPGFERRLKKGEIICSSQISNASTPGSTSSLGYQVSGPYSPYAPVGRRCDDSGCAKCSVPSPTANGSSIPVGVAAGAPDIANVVLYGKPQAVNSCECKCIEGADGSISCTATEPASM
ncbi:hypothetical protein [Methylococcus mesophilus]|uniref:hypothetical protein n=1 Tax=Methylococcus mesophilus TaxID=2993564 RepID=UPI00224AE10A|nr:hypothetical protein [Methylococcus mesophilus]UZR30614.1 hypothetical protein OOT43_08260 [Methylococcus mesophilus]